MEAGEAEYNGPSGLLAQRDHNLQAFMAALREVKQVPSDCMFSIADLEAEHEERPQVANCLLFIRSLASSQQMHLEDLQQPASLMSSQQQQQQYHQQYQHHQQQNTHSQYGHHHSNLRSSMDGGDNVMVTPQPLRSSCSRLPSQHQQQQYNMMTPPSVGMAYGQHSPSTRLSFAGATPSTAGSFGARLQARSTPGGLHPALPAPLNSPLIDGHGSLSHGGMVPYRSSSSSLTPASMHGGSITAATHKSVQAAAGVTKLVRLFVCLW